jgi:hypothetical protein
MQMWRKYCEPELKVTMGLSSEYETCGFIKN